MARTNIKGASFYNFELEPHEEKAIRAYIKEQDISAKQFFRKLIREWLATKNVKPSK